MKTFNFKLLTPEKTAYDDDIEKLNVMTESGQITIFADHERLTTIVVPGELLITKNGETVPMVVGQGALCIYGDSVELLANTTEVVSSVNLDRAEEALRRAREAMANEEKELDIDYARLEAVIERNLARIKIKSKYS
jgi:F-type H+-transporting ATPase subunit epsilon